MVFRPYIRLPRTAQPASLTAAQVARAYNFPAGDGTGRTVGLIELGGGFTPSQFPGVEPIGVAGGRNAPDGPNGADGEVQLDIGVVQGVASGAKIKVYFAPNTDSGFLAAIKQAVNECDVVSISWGGPESSWSSSTIHGFETVFAAARNKGVPVFVAAGDTGANDGTGRPTCDYPASSPNVIGCGGTRLTLNGDGARSSEVVWDDDDLQSATGGGVSRVFPGRQVPDVAGNADPDSGYEVTIDGERLVIGGTSAVAPLYAGLVALLGQAVTAPFDFLNTIITNPGVCFDVTSGDNGAYRAGVGRDEVTGFGVVDGTKLAQVLLDTITDPVPPTPAASTLTWDDPADLTTLRTWSHDKHTGGNKRAAQAFNRGH